jgi:hypothetical protein
LALLQPQRSRKLPLQNDLRDKNGRDDWIRTSDPLTPSQVRYQAAPHPVFEDPDSTPISGNVLVRVLRFPGEPVAELSQNPNDRSARRLDGRDLPQCVALRRRNCRGRRRAASGGDALDDIAEVRRRVADVSAAVSILGWFVLPLTRGRS